MRIAFLVPEFPSISQTFVLNQITGMIDKNHDVEIFALSSANCDKNHSDVAKYGLLNRTTYFPAIPSGRIKRIAKSLRYAFHYFKKYPKPVLSVFNFVKFGRLALSFTFIFRIIPFINKKSYDIIFCHFGPMGDIAVKCRLAGALKGKVITVFHGYDLTSYPRKFGKHVYDTLFKHSDLCLPISSHWKNKLIEMGCDARKIRVHRMGIDIRQFHVPQESQIKKDKIGILSIARLVEKKGIEFGIKAISMIRDQYPDIEYVIAGDGPLRFKLEKLIKNLNLDRNVKILGWLSQQEVTSLMLHSDILIAPSITANDGDQEGIPVVLMEAQAMGLPVISTYHSGIPELIIDGHNGFLVQEKDPKALADCIAALINSESDTNTFKNNGKQYIQKNYNIRILNTDLESIFYRTIRQ